VFGTRDKLAVERELTDTTGDYFLGKVRAGFGGLPPGDFAREIISTQMFAAEALWRIRQAPPAPAGIANSPAWVCIAELRGRYDGHGSSDDVGQRWGPFDFTNAFPYVDAPGVWIPLERGHRVVPGLRSGAVHDVLLGAGDLAAAGLGFSGWVQSQPGYGAGSRLARRSPT
jgi:hypothetical protein